MKERIVALRIEPLDMHRLLLFGSEIQYNTTTLNPAVCQKLELNIKRAHMYWNVLYSNILYILLPEYIFRYHWYLVPPGSGPRFKLVGSKR